MAKKKAESAVVEATPVATVDQVQESPFRRPIWAVRIEKGEDGSVKDLHYLPWEDRENWAELPAFTPAHTVTLVRRTTKTYELQLALQGEMVASYMVQYKRIFGVGPVNQTYKKITPFPAE